MASPAHPAWPMLLPQVTWLKCMHSIPRRGLNKTPCQIKSFLKMVTALDVCPLSFWYCMYIFPPSDCRSENLQSIENISPFFCWIRCWFVLCQVQVVVVGISATVLILLCCSSVRHIACPVSCISIPRLVCLLAILNQVHVVQPAVANLM